VPERAERHTSAEFIAFLTDIVINQPRGKEIHVIADNFSAHKSQAVKDFLAAHPKVHLHFTPTYSLWLSHVELGFGKIERDVIARGVFTSVSDLMRKLMKYIRHYNKVARTVKWRYADPSRHISTQSVGTGHQARWKGREIPTEAQFEYAGPRGFAQERLGRLCGQHLAGSLSLSRHRSRRPCGHCAGGGDSCQTSARFSILSAMSGGGCEAPTTTGTMQVLPPRIPK
jgi:transposase